MLNWNPLGNSIPAAVRDGARPGDLNAELIKNLGPRAGGNGRRTTAVRGPSAPQSSQLWLIFHNQIPAAHQLFQGLQIYHLSFSLEPSEKTMCSFYGGN